MDDEFDTLYGRPLNLSSLVSNMKVHKFVNFPGLAATLEDSDQSQCGSHFVSSNETSTSSEVVTSCSMTFRDPETGSIYLQTQLLQV